MLKRPNLVSTAMLGAAPLVFVLVAIFAFAPSPPVHVAGAAEVGPAPMDRTITQAVTFFMKRRHVSQRQLDDEISARMLSLYLKGLDPSKAYFMKSDVEQFLANKNKLDDLLNKNDVAFGFEVFNRYLERVDARVTLVKELLQSPPDTSIQEEFAVDADTSEYAATEEEARDFWRRRVKYEWLLLKQAEPDKEDKEIAESLVSRFERYLKRMKETSHDEILQRYLSSCTMAFDPHTEYMSPSTLENFYIRMRLNYQGIGAELTPGDDGYATISRIIPGGAAEAAGELKAKDRIVSVGQDEDGEMVDVVNKRLQDIIDLIRGPEGSVVRLGVLPAEQAEQKIYKITRARIELQDAAAAGEIMEAGAKPDGKPYRIGVIDLPSFYFDMEAAQRGDTDYRSTTRDVSEILKRFRKQQVDSVILDLRRNGGGSLPEAISLTGLFIDRGPVVQVKGPSPGGGPNSIDDYEDRDPGTAWGGPLVVLTSKYSASASEILAGAIQDYRRGLVVGDESTHGKGTVQTLMSLGDRLVSGSRNSLGALKITISQFYRPNGDSTQNRGVLSDVVLPSVSDVIAKGEKELDYAIAFDSIEPADFRVMDMISDDIKSKLQERSAERVADSEDFSKLKHRLERFKERQARHSVPLEQSEFAKYQGDDDEEEQSVTDEAVEQLRESRTDSKIQRTYYLEEVLKIAADYAGILSK